MKIIYEVSFIHKHTKSGQTKIIQSFNKSKKREMKTYFHSLPKMVRDMVFKTLGS